ncbi:MAG: hypothetical protein R3F12_09985 [Lysobacteraceae bacterium]|nr:hypothetical protein [Xanthomonadales bacterium]HPF73432.1 hypothetical protein [Xanthomonadaceae bacterium]HRX99827.1 hypothetical protein [Xanthomonadaceae bacterium]
MSRFTPVLLVSIVGMLLAACASEPERMTDTRQPLARDRAECNLNRDVVDSSIETPPSWCRDDEEALQWSSDDAGKSDMKVDFKRKHDDD